MSTHWLNFQENCLFWPLQGDDSPVGPLRMQLPDLTDGSDKDQVTVLLDEQAAAEKTDKQPAEADASAARSDKKQGDSSTSTFLGRSIPWNNHGAVFKSGCCVRGRKHLAYVISLLVSMTLVSMNLRSEPSL